MRQVRDVLRLKTAGVAVNEIARRVGVASSTVRLTLKRLTACRFNGWCCPNFSNRIIANRLGPAQPRASTWNGAGAWLIFSQSRQVNFSRMCWITVSMR